MCDVDAGNAGDVLHDVLKAIASNTTLPVILDQPRTLRVVHMSHNEDHVKVMTKDEDSGEFIAIFIPRNSALRARADLPSIPLSD